MNREQRRACFRGGLDQVITAGGLDPRMTPVDTMMAAPMSLHLAVAAEMEDPEFDFGDEA